MSETMIAGLIGAVATFIVGFMGIICNRSIKKKLDNLSNNNAYISFLKPDQNFNLLISNAKFILMYTVNSHELLNKANMMLEQNPNIKIAKLTILVRNKKDETASDLAILKSNISQWKNWVAKKRIKSLKIVGYDHDPDHYYTIIENRVAFVGQVFFDSTKPTGTNLNYLPLVFNDQSEAGKQVIKNYQSHFNNVYIHYQENVLYDSSIRTKTSS